MVFPKACVRPVLQVVTKMVEAKQHAKHATSTPIQTHRANPPKPIAPPAAKTVPRALPPATPMPPPVFANEPSTTKITRTNV